MRWQLVVLGGAIAAVAGCSSTTGPTGTVSGTYTRVGGPAGIANMPLPGTISFRSSSGSVITVNSDSTGRFSGQLPPGTYTVTASTPLVNDARNPCSQQLTTRVQAGKTITLALFCDIM